ncbi:MAG: endonuclease [Bacteroidales bacterium]|nr:endonuclease [Bacteroidales bacterium]
MIKNAQYLRWVPVILFIIVTAFCASGQPVFKTELNTESAGSKRFRIMFYNVENLFDTANDTLTDDEAFTPAGDLHWTRSRYYSKLANISKVTIALGGWNPPDVIGLCEIENRQVLFDLVRNTPRMKFNYGIVHINSPDRRGIDVALLYNVNTVRILDFNHHAVTAKGLKTRDILLVKSLLGADTCYFAVNHWPSRSSGQLESEKYRFVAARLLRRLTDSLLTISPTTKIVAMGDFNDDPTDASITNYLGALSPGNSLSAAQLYNLTRIPGEGPVGGTLKYQGMWNTFDQIMVSGTLLLAETGLKTALSTFTIFRFGFLLEPDETYNGSKPFRTYIGFRYHGGFSDHLPVYVDLEYE